MNRHMQEFLEDHRIDPGPRTVTPTPRRRIVICNAVDKHGPEPGPHLFCPSVMRPCADCGTMVWAGTFYLSEGRVPICWDCYVPSGAGLQLHPTYQWWLNEHGALDDAIAVLEGFQELIDDRELEWGRNRQQFLDWLPKRQPTPIASYDNP